MHPPNILDDFHFEESPEWAGEGEVVAKFYSMMEAEVAAARLRAEGIHCFIANAVSQSVLPHLQSIVRLHTRPSDADRARQILEEAAVESEEPLARKRSGVEALVFMAILLGLLLAWLLVQSIG